MLRRRREVGWVRGWFELWVLLEGGRRREEVVFDSKVVGRRRK